ncbi:MAG: TonB-dependent receptor [Bacteroidota bacterium]
MLKSLSGLALLCILLQTESNAQYRPKPIKNKLTDSSQAVQLNEEPVDDMPVIAVNESERSENNLPFVPSLLFANRDAFMSVAGFHFSVTRFRMRGYDGELFSTQINGMHMNNPDDGNTQWSLWSGLNDVTRNSQVVLGLRSGEQSFGNIGNMVSMDMRASKQRTQTQFNYSFANRSYTHRWMFTKSTAINKNGWAFSLSGSWRIAVEGNTPGTYYKGASYFIAIDKRLNEDHLLSMVFFGNQAENGKQGSVLEESVKMFGYDYNPYWGYQSGQKRNANAGGTHQPVLILTDDYRINNYTTLVTTIGCVAGNKSSTALDWYKAPDPRADYYRYLPSYQTDTVLRLRVMDAIKNNNYLRQVNWDHLYDVNRNSFETLHDANGISGSSFTGLRAHYVLEERVAGLKRLSIQSVYNTRLANGLSFTGGGSVQIQQTHYYKKINDLLGAEYSVDWNQFAERDFPDNPVAIQNDLEHPNRIIRTGDVYGYDYMVNTNKISGWAQVAGSKKKIDFFAAIELSYTNYLRDGKMRNGLFLFNSYGRSEMNEFSHYALKAGITYKINGRKYLYLHGAVLSKPPLFDNVFISPRTRDTKQENIQNEKIKTIEAGYILNAPRIKGRLSLYATEFMDGMNIMTFYHDGYGNFVNYALSGIGKLYYGCEFGTECKLTNRFTLNAAASVGRYYYNSRQQVSVSADNDAYILERTLIYSQNFRVGGTPQEAYGLGVGYQSQSGSFYLNLTGNYFRQQWLDMNPLRRTYAALENVAEGSEQWNRIIGQTRLPEQYTVDLSGGISTRVKLFQGKYKQTLVFNLSMNNLLNKQDIISGGYEQLRFDTDTKDTGKFPPKYFYAAGLNFSFNCSLRL